MKRESFCSKETLTPPSVPLPPETIITICESLKSTSISLTIKEISKNCTKCVVCLESFEDEEDDSNSSDKSSSSDTNVILRCGHRFHDVCIKKWLWRKRFCPICRDYIPIKVQSNASYIVIDDNDQCHSCFTEFIFALYVIVFLLVLFLF